jgi:hypothetical protein
LKHNNFDSSKTIRRPYVFLYNNEKDPLERGIINLSIAKIVYNEEQMEMLKVCILINIQIQFNNILN